MKGGANVSGMCSAACRLWFEFLAQCPIGFQMAQTINDIKVDFYCAPAHLAILIDADVRKVQLLEAKGIYVLVFRKQELVENFSQSCSIIEFHLKSCMQSVFLECYKQAPKKD